MADKADYDLNFQPRYFPDLAEGDDIEIARVTLSSTLTDVTWIRAKKTGDGYRYFAEDEYGTEFKFEPARKDSALTMGEVIGIIEQCEMVSGPRDFNIEGGLEPERASRFARVQSDYYPDLEKYYDHQADVWLDDYNKEQEAAHLKYEEGQLVERERREMLIAPYKDRIEKYLAKINDQTYRWPGSAGAYGTKKGWLRRFIEDYLVENGKLPAGKHSVKVKRQGVGFSGGEHDFEGL